jgi:glycosyltransferase involved in cell wall biosynthesis
MTRQFTPFADLVSLWQLYRVLKRERFTIVHTHTPKPGLLGQLAARLAGIPVVVNTVHGFYFHEHMFPLWRRFYITLEKIAAWCSDLILSQNQEDIQTAIKEGICRPEKIKYLGNGFDVQQFARACINASSLEQKRRELSLPADAPVIGFVGRLVAEKGIVELLQAARLIIDQMPHARFLFIGPLDEKKSDALTPAIAAQCGLDKVCIFTGRRHDMPELYALMDVLVLPSHREGFPRTPMEASFMGVPSVVTDIRGCREVVEHGQNGWLVPLGDVRALADAILQLLKNPHEAKRMGEAGRRLARERFDERQVFDRVKAEYARLLQSKHLPTPLL